MTHQGRSLTPSPTNNKSQTVRFMYCTAFHLPTSKYFQCFENRHDTLNQRTAHSYVTCYINCIHPKCSISPVHPVVTWNCLITIINFTLTKFV
jgi:hypothetical protein